MVLKGLNILSQIKQKFNVWNLDIHEASQCAEVKEFLDIIQIPAFLCRQTDILIEAGKTKLLLI